MRTRHRPPSLVSMWMLDVFCCALGCVTLLWLLSQRAAQEEVVRSRDAGQQLAETAASLKLARADAEETLGHARAVEAELAELKTARTRLLAEQDQLKSEVARLSAADEGNRERLAEMASRSQSASEELEQRAKALADAQARLKTLEGQLAANQGALKAKERAAADAEARAEASTRALADGQRELAAVGKEQRATGDTLRQTEDELRQARAVIVDLQGQKAKLADKFDRLQVEAEAKFAGISLTGRRVVFLVDVSGSMKLLDDKTPAPDKWATVTETVAKVMRSLPNLEQYQVLTFSRQARSLFPGGRWQDYQGEASITKVRDALAEVRPDGDTNMYEALELAFQQKPNGMDTLYLFSDGLPTSGPGLTAADEQLTTVQAKSDRLAKHVLQTLRTVWNRPGPGQVRINAVGFYFESPDLGAFLWALARENNGNFVGMSKP